MFWRVVDRLLLPIVFFLISFVVALTVWQLLLSHRPAEIQAATNERALLVQASIESDLKAHVVPLEALAERWNTRGLPNTPAMESEIAPAVKHSPDYHSIGWVHPDYHIDWLFPKNVEQRSLSPDSLQRSALKAAEDSKDARLSSPLTLENGDRGFIVAVPVYSQAEKLSGFLIGVFDYKELLGTALRSANQNYQLTVYDGNEAIYGDRAVSSPPGAASASVSYSPVQAHPWNVTVWPKPTTLLEEQSALPGAVFFVGILMSGLLALTVYMAETARLHAKEVLATNAELKKEITGRAQAEEALRQAQKMEAVGRLAGGIAHDFNNLLMVIRGHAALSINRVGPDSALRRGLSEILESTDKASALTRRLLAFSRKQVLQLRVLDLNTLVAQVKELLPPVLGDDINLYLELDPNLGRVKADAGQMEQVIMNLVFNARDAMPSGGDLSIQTANVDLDAAWVQGHAGTHVGPFVKLTVHDTGHGMTQETMSHMFEPFFTTKDISKGTGLGLATVYGTVTQSGGYITALSEVGKGTGIEIYLPRVMDSIEEVEAPKVFSQPGLGAETILVVEDDVAVRRMTREFLKIKGYTVIEAGRAAEAIQLMELHKHSIDLVLTDVLMPGMKGRELVERLSELHPGMKVLYMSAYTEDAAVNIGVLNPGTEFIEKPFSPDELAAKVRRVLDRAPTSLLNPLP